MNFDLFEKIVLFLFNTFSLFLVIVVLGNSSKERANKWFAVMTACMVVWVNASYAAANSAGEIHALLFYKINFAAVYAFIYSAYVFMVDSFLGLRKPLIRGGIGIVSSIFIYLSLFTGGIVAGTTAQSWGTDAILGRTDGAYNLFSVIAALVIGYFLLVKYVSSGTKERQALRPFAVGTLVLIVLNVVFNIFVPAYFDTGRFQNFGDYSSVFFIAAAAYAIARRQFLGVRIFLVAMLISVIGMLIVFDILLLSHSLLEEGVKATILIAFAVIAVILVRSVLNEIRQREELAKTNLALDKSRQRYIDLATEQKDIIDVMGHEIRTPLTAIVQEIKIHKKYTLPIEAELMEEASHTVGLKKILPYLLDTVKTVDRASAHAVALVTDMLETARLDKGRFTLNYEKFDLVQVVRDNVELMRKTVDGEDSSVAYHVEFADPGFAELPVEADKTRIGQAVYALLSNALKYRDPEKKEVAVSVSVRKHADHAVIDVSDNGLGIAREDISKLGKKFMRLNPKTGGSLVRPGGTGLGLFVVKGIMEHHRGEMLVKSGGMGQGSVFSLDFPVTKP